MAGDAHSRPLSPAAAAGLEVLRRRVRNIALAGRLRVSEARAVSLLEAVGLGTVLTLLRHAEGRRDPGLSEFARDTVMAAITGDAITPAEPRPSVAAAALRASLDRISVLTGGERHLLEELLDRIADGDARPPSAGPASQPADRSG